LRTCERKPKATDAPTGYRQTIEEHVDGELLRSYTFGMDEIVQAVKDNPAASAVVSQFLHDGRGSVRQLANALAELVQAATKDAAAVLKLDYTAYGTAINYAAETVATALLHNGEFVDPVTGQQYLRARWYNQSSGRFNRIDPFAGEAGIPQSLHKYLFAHGDPQTLDDPSGMSPALLLLLGIAFPFLGGLVVGGSLLVVGLRTNNAALEGLGFELILLGGSITAGLAIGTGAGIATGIVGGLALFAIGNLYGYLSGGLENWTKALRGRRAVSQWTAFLNSFAGNRKASAYTEFVFRNSSDIEKVSLGPYSQATPPAYSPGDTIVAVTATSPPGRTQSLTIVWDVYEVAPNGTLGSSVHTRTETISYLANALSVSPAEYFDLRRP